MFCLTLLVLTSVLFVWITNGSTYPSMTCSEESSYSTYDAADTWYKSSNYFLNGMDSYHSNSKEDRKFKMRYCKASTSSYQSISSKQTLPYTDWDSAWIRGCGGNTAIYYVYSYHSNSKEDRRFLVKCGNIDTDLQLSDCEWRGYYPADWDGRINFECPNNGVIRTIDSYHNNNKEDRKYKFECCRMIKSEVSLVSMSCETNDFYSNEYDGVHTNLKSGYFLSGLYSIHDNGKEDRKFKWKYCKPSSLGSSSAYVSYEAESNGATSYDAEWTRSCSDKNSGHAAIIKGYSTHSNSKEDRVWTFTCGLLDTEKYSLSNCAYTGYLNTWDDAVNFNCPNSGVIRSIWSKHDNGKEDRLWKFECCHIVEADYSFTNMAGSWYLLVALSGSGTISRTLTEGVSTTNSQEVTEAYSSALSVEISSGFEYMGVSGSVTVTGTIAQETANTISSSLSHSREESITVTCGENVKYLYQFIMDSDEAYVETQQYRCTNIPYPACGPGYFDCDVGDADCNTCTSSWPTS